MQILQVTILTQELKSTLGYVFMLARGAIAWKSVKKTQQLQVCKENLLLYMKVSMRVFG